jgi:hypothetical protein
MTTSPGLSTASSNLPAALDFLGPAPLICSEGAAGYDTLLAGIIGALKPAGILEEIWVRDVVVLVWEAERLRRLKAALMTACAHEGLDRVLLRFQGIDALGLSKRWGAGDADAATNVAQLLAAAGLTLDAVMAQTLRLHIDEIERIDRMIMSAETRRNEALRELDRHRAGFAAALRRAAEHVEDAEFEVVAPGTDQAPPT